MSLPQCPFDDYPLRVEVRPLLVSGMFGYGPKSIVILLCNQQSKQEATVTMWHEVVHMLKRLKGSQKVSKELEDEVEALAQKLAVACPEILELCGLEGKFKDETTDAR